MNALTSRLDDRTFDDLVAEGVTLLPTLAPEWTNHNPSDPGITLLELLAYFTELLVYRLGRVSPASTLQFIKLLGGAKWEGLTFDSKIEFLKLLMGSEWEGWKTITDSDPTALGHEIDCAVIRAKPAQLEKAVMYVVDELTRNECAITAEDFERFALVAGRKHISGPQPFRTLAVPCINLETARAHVGSIHDRAHVSVIIVPPVTLSDDQAENLRKKVLEDLLTRCLITTRVHVVPPVYLHLGIGMKIVLNPGQAKGQLSSRVLDALERRFGSEFGQGPTGEGWPFGRALPLSELTEAIDEIPGVDYVEDVAILQMSLRGEDLNDPQFALGVQIGVRSKIGIDTLLGGARILGSNRLRRNHAGKLVSIVLKPWELLKVAPANKGIEFLEAQPREVTNA